MSQDTKKAELIELLSKPEPFLSWLNKLNPTEVVGIRASERECPLAKFIVQTGICEWARVHPDYLFIYSYGAKDEAIVSVNTEEAGYWIERFVLAIDDKLGNEITADMAKDLLESLTNREDLESLGLSEYKSAIRKILKPQG